VSEMESSIFDAHNESRFAMVQSSGTSETGFHPHLGRPLDDIRGGPNGSAIANGHSAEGASRGGGLLAQDSVAVDDVGFIAKSQRAMKQAGRMCMGVNIPGTGHTAYVFDIVSKPENQIPILQPKSTLLASGALFAIVPYPVCDACLSSCRFSWAVATDNNARRAVESDAALFRVPRTR
jgi:hypothetical protein